MAAGNNLDAEVAAEVQLVVPDVAEEELLVEEKEEVKELLKKEEVEEMVVRV